MPGAIATWKWPVLSVCALSILLSLRQPAQALPSGIVGYSGKQGDTCNRSQCHSGGTAPLVEFDGPQEVLSGTVATFRFVLHAQSTADFFGGLDVAASDGVLGVLPTFDTRLEAGEVTHTAPKVIVNSQAAWTFTWQAPTAPATQTLYGAGLAANGNGTRDGDLATATTFMVSVVERARRGDANCDRAVSAGDVPAVLSDLATGQPGACALADADCDGGVGQSDVDAVIASIFGTPYPGCAALPTPTPTATPVLTFPTPTATAGTMTPTSTGSPRTATPTPSSVTGTVSPTPLVEWATFGQNQQRTFFNANETRITKDNVASMRFKWRYLTGAIVTASPTVAYIDVPGEGSVKVVFVSSWDGNFYALRASNGSRLWSFAMKPHPGGSYPDSASAEVTTVAGEQRVYVAGGMTVYCFAAATGELRWQFDAGTGCTTCNRDTERNEVESSPTVVDGLVYFGMDVNDSEPGKGGTYAVDAVDGHLVWYFDLETQTTCRPLPSDNVRRFDGFHTAAQLGLPDDFFATRPGCAFDRGSTACGNVWSSFAVDDARRMIYIASSNCDTDNDPNTVEPPPPMPPYDEAIFALSFDGTPVWVWRPREVDNGDLAFGAPPNLFEIAIGGTVRQVVGIGGKDGTYYLLDRDGTNKITGRIEPYWHTSTVPGGPIGGIIASPAVGDGQVFFSTAIGVTLSNQQQPAAWALQATDGTVKWSKNATPSYAPTTAIPGVVFMGGLFGTMVARDAATGSIIAHFVLGGPISSIASASTVVGGEIFVGMGTGARDGPPDDQAYLASVIPSYVSAICLPDAPDCPTTTCDDGNPCTYDFHGTTGCESEPAPEGLPCQVGPADGNCKAGLCQVQTPAPTAGPSY